MNSRRRKVIALALLVATAVAAVAFLLFAGQGGSGDNSPSGVAEAYMRAQLSSDPDVCKYMTEEMQQSWIGNVETSFSPGDTPKSCDAATKVFIDWSKRNGQLEVDPGDVQIQTSNERVKGDEATVTVRSTLSKTNRSQTDVQLARVDGRWLVAGTEAP